MTEENRELNKTEVKGKLPTKLALMFRVGVALYLFYTVYSLRDVFGKYGGGQLVFFVGMMALFTFVGIAVCFFSLRDLMQGRYAGGVLDRDTEAGEEKEGEKEEEEKES